MSHARPPSQISTWLTPFLGAALLLLLLAPRVSAQTLCATGSDCDDHNVCTDDSCQRPGLPLGVCLHTPNTNPCTDNDACTEGDQCVLGLCVSGLPKICSDNDVCNGVETCNSATGACQLGTPLVCDDGLACTNDSCNATLGCLHTPVQNCCTSDAQCNDGNVCNGAERCNTQSGACVAGVPLGCVDGDLCTQDGCDPSSGCTFTPIGGCCLTALDCNDGDLCTIDTCDLLAHVCSHAARDCSDGNVCNGDEICNPATGNCDPGATLSCDDGSACTLDVCVPFVGCTNTAIAGCCTSAAECSDGDACNGTETCDSNLHICLPGIPLLCNNANVCDGQETCDPATGCVAGAPLSCDDGMLCTQDICSPATGCLHAPIPGCCVSNADCDDHDPCNGIETCGDNARCQPATPTDCDDGNQCTLDVCVPLLGCEHLPAIATCDDGNACTVGDVCLNGQCLAGLPRPCSDGNVCNGVETCNPATGACQPGTPLDCDDGASCTDDQCLPLIGCTHTSAAGCCGDDTSCVDTTVCNGAESCDIDSGLCLAGLPLLCVDGNACTVDACSATGGCTFEPITGCCNTDAQCDDADACTIDLCNPLTHVCHHFSAPCTDGDPCNGEETCNPTTGRCDPGTRPSCDDGVACTTDTCVPFVGCTNVPGPLCCASDADCDDRDACNGQETCLTAAGTCLHGVPLFCDNLNPCDGTETCDPAVGCVRGTPLNCDDGVPCTLDTCDPLLNCTHVPISGCCTTDAACDDHDVCTGRETCVGFTCRPGAAISCDDDNSCTDDVCVGSPGCEHVVNRSLCSDLDLGPVKVHTERAPGVGNGRIQGRGSFLTPPIVSGTPPITLRVQDAWNLDLTHTFESCSSTSNGRMMCRDATAQLKLIPFGRPPGFIRLRFQLIGLPIAPPLAGPLTVTLTHDGTRRADVILGCKQKGKALSCRRR